MTVPHTPQQNGVAERKNRHLCETMRTLLFEAKLPTYLWEEAVRTANYVANRMPHRALKATTPLERFSGKKPDISHLRIFGCRSYIHSLPSNKFQVKSLLSTFVGYDDQSKAYRCFDHSRRKIIISRNVKFDETVLGLPSTYPSPPEDYYHSLDEFLHLNSSRVLTRPLESSFDKPSDNPT